MMLTDYFRSVDHGGWGILTPRKYVGGVRVCFDPKKLARYSLFVLKVPLNPKQTNKTDPPKMSHSFIQSCCWIALQVSHRRIDLCQKWKVKLIFRGA